MEEILQTRLHKSIEDTYEVKAFVPFVEKFNFLASLKREKPFNEFVSGVIDVIDHFTFLKTKEIKEKVILRTILKKMIQLTESKDFECSDFKCTVTVEKI